MMRELQISRGYIALVDDEDFERLSKVRWYVLPSNKTNYALCHVKREDGRWTTVYLHRRIVDAPHGSEVDHINGNGLDCRRSNLRLATRRQQCQNVRPRSASGYKGTYFLKTKANHAKPWYARIEHHDQKINLGYFATAEEAARAYDEKAKELFGEFAYLNLA